jgi:phage recombination protein Bet
MNEIVKYKTDQGVEIEITHDDVRSFFSTGSVPVNSKEVTLFLGLCRSQGLNPFLKEAYLVKYSEKSPATLIVGKEAFTKRAAAHPDFEGFEAGITVARRVSAEGGSSGAAFERREGSMYSKGSETLVGGWARVYVKGNRVPFFEEVALDEYMGYKKDYRTGQSAPSEMWATKPATMIRKVALVHALREAFPDRFAGLYDASEMGEKAEPLAAGAVTVEDVPQPPTGPPPAPAQPNPLLAEVGARVRDYAAATDTTVNDVVAIVQQRLGVPLKDIGDRLALVDAALEIIEDMHRGLPPSAAVDGPTYETEDIPF